MTAIPNTRKVKAALAATALTLGAMQTVQAQDLSLSVSLAVPGVSVVVGQPAPSYVVAPAPVYVAAPPRVVVVNPAPVYVVPRGHRHYRARHYGYRYRHSHGYPVLYAADSLPRGNGGWDSRLYGPSGQIGSR